MDFTTETDWSGSVLEAYPNLRTRIQVWYTALNPSGRDETITYQDFDLPVNGHAISYARPDSEHGPTFFPMQGALTTRRLPICVNIWCPRSRADNPLLLMPYAYEYLGSANKSLVVFEGADHFLFSNDCAAIPWAIESGIFWGCADAVWDMDRAHDLINHFTTAFLLSVLYGDADATAALAPDAVSFPGITYETTGF